MAIDAVQMDLISRFGEGGKALSAGYPDLLIERPKTPRGLPQCEWRFCEWSEAAGKHHGLDRPIPDSFPVFKWLGYELEVIDREAIRGVERVVDLNEPQELGEYDLVIDPGTIEHCFNIAQAAKNLAEAVKVGGIISQAVPMAMFNHGYYNANPVLFIDFYRANGFQIECFLLRCGDWIMNNVSGRRMHDVPDGTVNVLIARRLEKRPIVWPQQA